MLEIRTPCKDREYCGGCAYQEMAYEEQLALKYGEVKELVEQKELPLDKLLPIEPAPDIYGYRNKMEYTFGDMEKDGPLTLGMHRRKHFMSIVTVDECQLVHDDFNTILKGTLAFAKDRGYTKYHKKSHKGLLRNLVLRRGVRTGEILVNIVTSSEGEDGEDEGGFDEAAFVEMILALPLKHEIAGVIRTINDRLADAVYCDELRVLYGKDHYEEEICGLKFQVGAFSFFQTNVEAAERLYNYATSLIEDVDGKSVFDLYCGTGTISQVMARKASHVTGIELVEEAVDAAGKSAELNGLKNCSFYAGDVFEVMSKLPDRPDVIIVDPPRMGMRPEALEQVAGYGVDQIVYVSCNPKTLVENLYFMKHRGYEIESIKPFDNFPWTKHVEAVTLLSRAK